MFHLNSSDSKRREMRNDDLISVIVPIYNVSQYLPRCIKSILNQNASNLQIILVDDGSTDDSGDICDNYAKADGRIEVIHKENGGPTSARKAGLKKARGKYIGFVDGDDYITSDMYQELYKRLVKENADFVHSGFVKNNETAVCGVEVEGNYFITEEKRIEFLMSFVFAYPGRYGISPSIWSKLFKLELLLDVFNDIPDTLSYGEDLLSLCSCFLKCKKISIINRAYYHYVIREGSICHERNILTVTREFNLYQHLSELFKKYNNYFNMKDSIERYFLRGLSCALHNLKGIPSQNYKYPMIEELLEKRIVLYGAGEVGMDYYSWISRYSSCDIVAWVDRNYQDINLDYCKIVGIENLSIIDFDVLVIGVLFEETAIEIRDNLLSADVSDKKIIWRKPEFIL